MQVIEKGLFGGHSQGFYLLKEENSKTTPVWQFWLWHSGQPSQSYVLSLLKQLPQYLKLSISIIFIFLPILLLIF